MPQEYETLVHQWFEEVWNKKNEDAIAELFAEDGIMNGITGAKDGMVRGHEEFKDFYRAFTAAYPDIKFTVEDTVTEGDKIAARCTVTATHTGDGFGIPATNQPIQFSGMGIAKIKNGKFVEVWNEFDFIKMYSQIGFNLTASTAST